MNKLTKSDRAVLAASAIVANAARERGAYRSEDVEHIHEFLILLYYAGAPLRTLRVEANCYADAVQAAAPGNDVVKVEVIAL